MAPIYTINNNKAINSAPKLKKIIDENRKFKTKNKRDCIGFFEKRTQKLENKIKKKKINIKK
jgi:hypothetical protein